MTTEAVIAAATRVPVQTRLGRGRSCQHRALLAPHAADVSFVVSDTGGDQQLRKPP